MTVLDRDDRAAEVARLEIVDDDLAVWSELECEPVGETLIKLNLCIGHGSS